MAAKPKAPFYPLLIIPFVWALSNSMIIPALPKIQRAMGIGPVQGSLLITALSVPTAILLPLAGFLSDRYGRTTIMIPALILYGSGGVAAALGGLTSSYAIMILARIVQGIGAAGTNLVAMSLAGDLFPARKRSRILGFLEASNSTGKLVSPLLGSLVSVIAWFAPFLVYPLFSFPAALLIFWQYRNYSKKKSKQSIAQYFRALKKVIKRKGSSLAWGAYATLFTVLSWFGHLFFLSDILAERFDVTATSRGFLLSLPVIALAVTAATAFRLLNQLGLVRITALGLGLIGFTFVLSPLWPQWVIVYINPILIGAATGLVLPALNSLMVSATGKEERGVVTTSYGSVRALGSAFGPLLFGWLMGFGDTVLFLSAGGLALSAAVASLVGIDEEVMVTSKPGPQ